jgi:hypothetical protein
MGGGWLLPSGACIGLSDGSNFQAKRWRLSLCLWCLYFGVWLRDQTVALWAVGGLLRHCASDDHVLVIGPAAGSLKPLLRSCPSAFSDTWVPLLQLWPFIHVKTAC